MLISVLVQISNNCWVDVGAFQWLVIADGKGACWFYSTHVLFFQKLYFKANSNKLIYGCMIESWKETKLFNINIFIHSNINYALTLMQMVGFINYCISQFLRNCFNYCFNNCWIIGLHTCLFWSPCAFLSFFLRKERSEDFTFIFKANIGFSVWMSELWQDFCYLAVLKWTCLPRSLHLTSCISSYERISFPFIYLFFIKRGLPVSLTPVQKR